MPIRMTSSYMYDGVACSKPALAGNRYGSYRSGGVLSFRRIGTLGKENSISADDMQRLKSIERIKDYGEASFFPVFGGRL